MKFMVEIELGNASMTTGNDVAQALEILAEQIEDESLHSSSEWGGSIRDVNGNTVGNWRVTR